MSEPLQLVTAKTDTEEAEEIRASLKEPLAECARIIEKARAKGLIIQFAINPDSFGRQVPTVNVVKPL